MILGIDPKVDYAFKRLFGREETSSILIDVLDSVLNPPPGQHIRDIELLNPFNPKETQGDKLSILDIKARDQSGRQFNVEMQMLAFPHYAKRILYYACKLHQQQMHEGEAYLKLRPTVSISFLNHALFPQVPEYHLFFRLLEQQHQLPLTGDLEFHLLELPKFKKEEGELVTGLDVWLYFLRHAAKIDTEAVPEALQRPLVRRALEELKMLTQTEIERQRYEDRLQAQSDHNTILEVARLAQEDLRQAQEKARQARQEGRAEGEKIGVISAIHLCERLLHRPETPTEQLARLSLEDLTRLDHELEEQLLKPKKAEG